MKYKLNSPQTRNSSLMISGIHFKKTFRANELSIRILQEAKENYHYAHIEDILQLAFDIDSETMDEHFKELFLFMVHQKFVDKLSDN